MSQALPQTALSTVAAPSLHLATTRQSSQPIPASHTRRVTIAQLIDLADGIREFVLLDSNGHPLPSYTVGAHIDVYLPNGDIRQYSLCGTPDDATNYRIAVQRDAKGRGGSIFMHDQLTVGSSLGISAPKNQFPLVLSASRYIFLAGGIGITPILPMVRLIRMQRKQFHLYYYTRSEARTAFLGEVISLAEEGVATIIHDHGNPSAATPLTEIVPPVPAPGDYLYYCGPPGFLNAVECASAQWPSCVKKCERFSADDLVRSALGVGENDTTFTVQLARSGRTLTVPRGVRITDVLRSNGVSIDTSCEQGYCGTCITRYLAGHVQHRDSVLDEDDRKEFAMLCCARSQIDGDCIVLDL